MADFEGFDELAAQLQHFAEEMDEAATLIDPTVDRAVRKTAAQVERTAKQNLKANGSVDTGNLRTSIAYRQSTQGEYVVGTPVEYAPEVEYGRGPVEADDGYLRFEIDGEVLYRKSVGPAEAKPYLRPALQEHESDLVENIADAIDELFEEVFG